jgi:hypothetical protein
MNLPVARRLVFATAVLVTCWVTSHAQQTLPPPPAGQRGQGGRAGGFGGPPPAPDDTAGFTQIFDGKSLTGWDGDPTFWRAENGAIVGESTPEKRVAGASCAAWTAAAKRVSVRSNSPKRSSSA